jgi:hypothetical protein
MSTTWQKEAMRRADARASKLTADHVERIIAAIRAGKNVPDDVIAWLLRSGTVLTPVVKWYIADRLDGKRPKGRPMTSLRAPYTEDSGFVIFHDGHEADEYWRILLETEDIVGRYDELRQQYRAERRPRPGETAIEHLAEEFGLSAETIRKRVRSRKKVP